MMTVKHISTAVWNGKSAADRSADVYDAGELVPWIRTFICRIVSIHFSNQELAAQFKRDIDAMARLYGLNGGDEA